MNQKDNNLNFNKSINNDSSNNLFNPQNQKEKIILKIMNKYGVSYSEAEKILLKLLNENEINEKRKRFENKQIKNKDSIQNQNNSNVNSLFLRSNDAEIQSNEAVIAPQPVEVNIENNSKNNLVKEISRNSVKTPQKGNLNFKKVFRSKQDFDGNQEITVKGSNKKQISNIDSEKLNSVNLNQKINSNKINPDNFKHNEDNSSNVDSILEEIIPDYNKQISIKVSHVDLTFEVHNEKVDTLKESFIRFLKRNKSKKIKIHALNDVSFQIYKGEKVGIIGYNGAGKSTLLNVITGIYPPDNGEVITNGNISPLLSLGAGFDHNFSGRRNIMLNGAVLGYGKEYLQSKIDEIIEFSELGDFIDIPIKNYSSGMIAKLGFSIATSVNPDILVIDEILGVGDVNFVKKSTHKIKSLMDDGTTVILVSHSIPQIRELCDKAIWIDNGRVRDIGEVNKVCDEYLKDAEKASNEQLANIQFR